jgi:hypothetical protein
MKGGEKMVWIVVVVVAAAAAFVAWDSFVH